MFSSILALQEPEAKERLIAIPLFSLLLLLSQASVYITYFDADILFLTHSLGGKKIEGKEDKWNGCEAPPRSFPLTVSRSSSDTTRKLVGKIRREKVRRLYDGT